jgi:hypothetical protein
MTVWAPRGYFDRHVFKKKKKLRFPLCTIIYRVLHPHLRVFCYSLPDSALKAKNNFSFSLFFFVCLPSLPLPPFFPLCESCALL